MSHSDESRRTRVFISHQWTDKQLADRLARDLESLADVWMDYRNLRPGDSIQRTIDEALEGTDLVLVIWTTNSSRSAGVQAELETSLRLGLRVVPCLFEYDASGRPTPPLPEALADVLGVDFHHYGSGLAQVADLIVSLESERLPAEARLDEDHPGRRLLEYLRGYLSYLANYRSLRDVPDERAVWIDRILGEIEGFLDRGGDPALVRAMVEAAKRSEVHDPEGIGALVRRLEEALLETDQTSGRGGPEPSGLPTQATSGGHGRKPSGRQAQEARVVAGPEMGSLHTRSHDAGVADGEMGEPGPRAEPVADIDELTRRVSAIIERQHVPTAVAAIDRYLLNAVPALQALQAYAVAAGSPAGMQVVEYLRRYLGHADDLIPDGQGRYGHLDDAWLILNTAYRLLESGLAPAAALPVEWPTIIAADPIVRAVLPPEVLEALTAVVFEMLRMIQAEMAAYQPVFQPTGRGYEPHIGQSGGGSWEDQMNSALLGTGLSVDG